MIKDRRHGVPEAHEDVIRGLVLKNDGTRSHASATRMWNVCAHPRTCCNIKHQEAMGHQSMSSHFHRKVNELHLVIWLAHHLHWVNLQVVDLALHGDVICCHIA